LFSSFTSPKDCSNFSNNFFQKPNIFNVTNDVSRINSIFNNYFSNDNYRNLSNALNYSNLILTVNDDSDKKKITHPMYKIFNSKITNKDFYNTTNVNKLQFFTDLNIVDNNSELKNLFFNKNLSYKASSVFSSNQSVGLQERYIRNFLKNSPYSSNYNYSLNLNTIGDYLDKSNSSFGFNNLSFFNLSSND